MAANVEIEKDRFRSIFNVCVQQGPKYGLGDGHGKL